MNNGTNEPIILFDQFNSSTYKAYQNYYLLGLNRFISTKNLYSGKFSRLLSRAFPFEKPLSPLFCHIKNENVGQYIIKFPQSDKTVRFAIDTHDHRDVCSQDILKWCDIYFKSNKWSTIHYDSKVFPIINGNGILSKKIINKLINLRDIKPEKDLTFISRIWGGKEHNIRLFEQLSKIQCSKKLLAIFLNKDKQNWETTLGFIKRLEKASVEYTFHPVSQNLLWNTLAKSKLVMLRAGVHLCIPWRMLDLLCLGSAIIMDSTPYPKWPIPLTNGHNFIDLEINRPDNTEPGQQYEYDRIPTQVETLLENTPLIKYIKNENINYFENCCAPDQVATYIITIASKFV